jgi:hypothetical protein
MNFRDVAKEDTPRPWTAALISVDRPQRETAKFTIFETADKYMLHKTLIRLILMYGSESWPLSKKDENLLQIFERRILRRTFVPVN